MAAPLLLDHYDDHYDCFPCCLLSTQLFLFTLLSQYYSKIFLINTVLVTVTLLIAAIAVAIVVAVDVST